MPKSTHPDIPEEFATQESLTTFAVSEGYHPPLAARLFDRLLRTVMEDLKQRHGVELDVRYVASPEKRWPHDSRQATYDIGKAGLMISVSSLREAARHLYPNYSWQYGKTLDDLLKAWVQSLP